MEQVVDAEVAHLGLESRPQVEDRLRSPRGKLGGLVDLDRRRLAGCASRAKQLLSAHQRYVEKLACEIFEARVARTRSEQVCGEEGAERPLALAATEGAERELCLLGVVAADRPALGE